MASRLIPILILFLNTLALTAQDIVFARSIDPSKIITQLFEGVWQDSTKMCVWKPNLAEKLQFGESFNGLLYTSLDTSFIIETEGPSRLILVTATFTKSESGEVEPCRPCAPGMSIIQCYFDASRQQWILDQFYKFVTRYGLYGTPTDISLLRLSDDDFFIKIDGIDISQGTIIGYTDIYFQGSRVLTYSNFESNIGTGGDNDNIYEYETSISVEKQNNSIVLHKTGTGNVERGNSVKVEKIDETSVFIFRNGMFEKECK